MSKPCDTEDHENVELPAKPTAKVLCIGSFSPAWDAERKARNAQQQLANDLAMVGIHSADAGSYDPDDKGAA